jgi:hypothetical protein
MTTDHPILVLGRPAGRAARPPATCWAAAARCALWSATRRPGPTPARTPSWRRPSWPATSTCWSASAPAPARPAFLTHQLTGRS